MTAEVTERAFRRQGLIARVAPFAVAAVAAVMAAAVEAGSGGQGWLLLGAVLTGLAIALAVGLPWAQLPTFMDALPALLFIGAVAAIRHAAGGSISGFSALYLIPVLWLALYGTRAQMLVAVGLVGAALVVPILLAGPPDYPDSEWRRVVILVSVAGTLGLIVQRLVHEVVDGRERAIRSGQELRAQREVTDAILTAASDAIVSFDRSGTIVAANAEAATLFGRDDLVGRDVFDALVPDDERERLRAGLGRILASAGPTRRDTRFEADVVRADGSRVPVEIAMARTEDPADGLRLHAFVRDTTTRRAAERAAGEHLDDLGRLLAVAQDSGRATGGDARSAICAAARDLARADFVLFYTPDGADGRLVVTGSAGDDAPIDVVLDPDRSVAGSVMRSGRSVVSLDLASDTRVDAAIVARVGAGAAYWLPVTGEAATVGVLIACWRRPLAALPERTAAILGLFAVQASAMLERADLLARLEGLASTDALTGAANRRTLDAALIIALAEARRSGHPLSVAMLDLDHFKQYNDRHGHQAGDDLLRAAAAAWQRELRPGDTLARYGGEEFAVILPACDAAASVVVADRLRAALVEGATVSAGVATWDGEESSSALIARADAALYRAKAAGRDRTVASAPAGADA